MREFLAELRDLLKKYNAYMCADDHWDNASLIVSQNNKKITVDRVDTLDSDYLEELLEDKSND